MIHSMTGYGKAIAQLSNKKITIEIRSLNSKQFDLFTRIPIIYKDKEIALRNELSKLLERGKIDLFFNIEYISKDVSSKIDHNIVRQYHQEIKKLSQELGINEPADLFQVLMRMPDVMKQDSEEVSDEEWETIEFTVKKACDELNAFRIQEGEMLYQILRKNIEKIGNLSKEIEIYEKERVEKIKNRIQEELSSLDVEYDKSRFEQEMIYYIEKLDINEEKNRLANHLQYFIETMDNSSTSQGKKLGFIAQEIGREINTMGSKSNQSEMQRIVVQMKDELEQIKEQILNVL